MAERFGAQAHPNGGLRFGSQTYGALAGTTAGAMAAVESGADTFVGVTLPGRSGSLAAVESGADTFAASGISSRAQTLQGYETGADTFIAAGTAIAGQSYRFGSQAHPLGGLRFGSQSWAALGPSATMAAAETGADTLAAVGRRESAAYTFVIYTVAASFISYDADSLGSAITGTLDDGYKVMLPISGAGWTAAWELNQFSNPSLRLADLDGTTNLSAVPWYVWNGSTWTAASFDVSDAIQGAVFMVESGVDTFAGNGSNTVYGSAVLVETGADFTQTAGGVAVRGALAASETGADSFAAAGAPRYVGALAAFEHGVDALAADGVVAIAGTLAATETGSDTLAATGQRSLTGTMDATETGADVFTATAGITSTGAMAATEAATADTFAGVASLPVTGTVQLVEAGVDTFAATSSTQRIGVATIIESSSDTLAAAGVLPIAGALAATEEPDRFIGRGFRISTGHMAAFELAAFQAMGDRFVASGYGGDINPPPDLDRPIIAESTTPRNTITSKQQARAA